MPNCASVSSHEKAALNPDEQVLGQRFRNALIRWIDAKVIAQRAEMSGLTSVTRLRRLEQKALFNLILTRAPSLNAIATKERIILVADAKDSFARQPVFGIGIIGFPAIRDDLEALGVLPPVNPSKRAGARKPRRAPPLRADRSHRKIGN